MIGSVLNSRSWNKPDDCCLSLLKLICILIGCCCCLDLHQKTGLSNEWEGILFVISAISGLINEKNMDSVERKNANEITVYIQMLITGISVIIETVHNFS